MEILEWVRIQVNLLLQSEHPAPRRLKAGKSVSNLKSLLYSLRRRQQLLNRGWIEFTPILTATGETHCSTRAIPVWNNPLILVYEIPHFCWCESFDANVRYPLLRVWEIWFGGAELNETPFLCVLPLLLLWEVPQTPTSDVFDEGDTFTPKPPSDFGSNPNSACDTRSVGHTDKTPLLTFYEEWYDRSVTPLLT